MKIAVLRIGGMGDILLTTPSARALSRHFGTQEIDYIVGPENAVALEGIPYVRRILPLDRKRDTTPAGLLAFGRRLAEERYDLFVNFQPSVKTLLLTSVARAQQRLIFRKARRPDRTTGRVRHAIDDFAKELAALGVTVTDRQMDFVVPESARATLTGRLLAQGIGPHARLVAINPAGTREINRWPPDRFAGLIGRLQSERPDLTPVLIGGPRDQDLARAVQAALSLPVLDLTGTLSVQELGALFVQAAVVLTGDTGPLHIASAVRARIVCLSGAADPDRTGPTARHDLVVIHRELPCVPCRARTCRRGDIACMTQMPVEWVFDAIERRISA